MPSNKAIYLCALCGQTMAYWLKGCVRCRSKTVERFFDASSPDFRKRYKEVLGMRDPVSPTYTNLLVLVIICTSLAAGWFVMNYFKLWPTQRQIATGPGHSRPADAPVY